MTRALTTIALIIATAIAAVYGGEQIIPGLGWLLLGSGGAALIRVIGFVEYEEVTEIDEDDEA